MTPSPNKLTGLKVLTFESRRAKEMVELIQRQGGTAISAPAMREIPISENKPALEFAKKLKAHEFDAMIFLTGVGTRYLMETIESEISKEDFATAVSSILTIARGPKPTAVLRELGVVPSISVPEPNTWKEILVEIDKYGSIKGKCLALQEYGEENPELVAGLTERGANVMRVPIYRWALPEDLHPLQEAIQQIIKGEMDIALFTTATQAEHLFQVAGSQSSTLQKAFESVVVASIGPICSKGIKKHGLKVDLEPEHPKMGSFVLNVAQKGQELVKAKRKINPL